MYLSKYITNIYLVHSFSRYVPIQHILISQCMLKATYLVVESLQSNFNLFIFSLFDADVSQPVWA